METPWFSCFVWLWFFQTLHPLLPSTTLIGTSGFLDLIRCNIAVYLGLQRLFQLGSVHAGHSCQHLFASISENQMLLAIDQKASQT